MGSFNEQVLEGKKFISIKTLCQYLGKSEATIYRKKKKGELPPCFLDSGKLFWEVDVIHRFYSAKTKKQNPHYCF